MSGPVPASQMASSEQRPDTPSNAAPSIIESELRRAPTLQTRYMDMLLSLDNIPRSHNILVACSTWIFLAGFVIFPGTFTGLQASESFKKDEEDSQNAVKHAIMHTVRNVPLLWVAGSC